MERKEYSAVNLSIFRCVVYIGTSCLTTYYLDTDLHHLDHKEEAEGEGAEDQEHRAEGDERGEVSRHLALALTLLLEANISTVEGGVSITN